MARLLHIYIVENKNIQVLETRPSPLEILCTSLRMYLHQKGTVMTMHGRINSLAGHTVYAYSSGLRAVQFLLRNYATRVDKKGIAPEQGFILLDI